MKKYILDNVHLVQLGFDTDVFDENAAQDSCARQVSYAQYLANKHPGARLTNIVLTDNQSLQKKIIGNLTLDPQNYYRLRHIYPLLKYLRKLHKQNSITVVTTQEFHGIFWAGLAFGRISKVPVIAQHHSDLASDYYREENFIRPYGHLYERIALWLVKAFDGLRVVNMEAKKFLEATGYKKRIGVLPVPVTLYPACSEDCARQKRDKNILKVLFVGRFARVKNLECWVHTAHQALQSCEQLEFVLIGDGGERGKIEKISEELGLQEHLKFVGALPPGKLATWYASSDVLLLTSHYEGFPRVIVEAMNYGLVPVCTDVNGLRDIIEHGVNGYLAEPTPEKLSAFLVELAKNPDKRMAMGKRARDTVKERYSPDKLRKEWIDFILSFIPLKK